MTSRTRGTARKLSTTPACNVPGLQGRRPLTWGLQKVRRGTAQGAEAAVLSERRSEDEGQPREGHDDAEEGKGAKGRENKAHQPKHRKLCNLTPAARGRCSPGARRREGASRGAQLSQYPPWGGAQGARPSSAAPKRGLTPHGRGPRGGTSGLETARASSWASGRATSLAARPCRSP